MEFPRGLLLVIGWLSLGICVSGFRLFEGTASSWLVGGFLVGRLAAIFGIMSRKQLGWCLALLYMMAIITWNGINGALAGSPSVIADLVLPAGCLIYLITVKDEFE